MPVGAGAGLRAAAPGGVQLGYQRAVADRDRRRSTCSATSTPWKRSSTDGADHDQHRGRRPPTQVFDYVPDPSRFVEWRDPQVGEKCHTTRRIGFAERPATSELTPHRPTTNLGCAQHRRPSPCRRERDRRPARLRRPIKSDDLGRLRRPRNRETPRATRRAPASSQRDADQPRHTEATTGSATGTAELKTRRRAGHGRSVLVFGVWVSYIRAATTSPDAAVMAATIQIAARSPHRSAVMPASSAPIAKPASRQSR